MVHPRVLIVALAKVNQRDTESNGLFLRNLFGKEWPRENLAQIYSSGDSGDQGFFGRYYRLGPNDRFLGSIFYQLKPIALASSDGQQDSTSSNSQARLGFFSSLRRKAAGLLVDTGFYELIFRPKISAEMLAWIKDFKPDIILAQGYNLTFTWLPLMLKKKTGAKLAVLTTDDWPKYQYAGMHGESASLKWLVRPFLKNAAKLLFSTSNFSFAFGLPMAEEYRKRYGRNYTVLNHSDDPHRFSESEPQRVHGPDVKTIAAIGSFNRHRLPLLLDLEEACAKLCSRGINVRGAVFSSAIDANRKSALSGARHIDIFPDPGHDALPSYLKGADILFLAEGFDAEFVSAIELSVSSKAHLFMFSQRPIIVYSAQAAGIAKYAKRLGWAQLVCERSSSALGDAIQHVITKPNETIKMIGVADQVARQNHTHISNRSIFLSTLLGRN